jgi:hypothetical protein
MAPAHTLVAAVPADAVMELSVAAIHDQWATTQSETLPSAEYLGWASVGECHLSPAASQNQRNTRWSPHQRC